MEDITKLQWLATLICILLVFFWLWLFPASNSVGSGLGQNASAATFVDTGTMMEKTITLNSSVPPEEMPEEMLAENQTWEYFVFLPQGYNASRAYPLIVGLHGAGGSALDYCRMWEGEANGHGFILACLQSNDSTGWWPYAANVTTIAIVHKMQESYNISDIFLSGYSAGARLSYHVSLWNPHVFRGISIASGSFFWTPSQDELKNAKGQHYYVFHGEDDTVRPLSDGMVPVNMLEQYGANVTFTLLPNHGHEFPSEEKDNITEWFISLENSSS